MSQSHSVIDHQTHRAARRYRQKRVDQMSSLEAALKEVERERDALKVRVAKLEGETDILKSLLSKKN
ncbi:bZIP transcription factor [Botrytis cinerea]